MGGEDFWMPQLPSESVSKENLRIPFRKDAKRGPETTEAEKLKPAEKLRGETFLGGKVFGWIRYSIFISHDLRRDGAHHF